MADWKNKINIARTWKTENPIEIAKDIISQLPNVSNNLTPHLIRERDDIINEFESFIQENDESDVDGFDSIFHRLYDWGDVALDNRFNGAKVCWIEIISENA